MNLWVVFWSSNLKINANHSISWVMLLTKSCDGSSHIVSWFSGSCMALLVSVNLQKIQSWGFLAYGIFRGCVMMKNLWLWHNFHYSFNRVTLQSMSLHLFCQIIIQNCHKYIGHCSKLCAEHNLQSNFYNYIPVNWPIIDTLCTTFSFWIKGWTYI